MGYLEIILLSLGLAMDAFAVSICKGMSLKKMNWGKAFIAGGYFGLFQGLMPLIGYFIVVLFRQNNDISLFIDSVDHWVAFVLLVIIGVNMIKESFSKEEQDCCFNFKTMIVLAIATSIDALSVGLSFGAVSLEMSIFIAILIIGVITFVTSSLGVLIGNVFGMKFKQPAEIFGGVVLVLIGLKILLEGLGVILL